MEDYISREEHREFKENMQNEHIRMNKRLTNLEEAIGQTNELALSVKQLAVNMEYMIKEQQAQGKRLEELEGRDGEMWRKVVSYAATAVIGIVVGFIFTQIGM